MGRIVVNQEAAVAIAKQKALRAVDDWFAESIAAGFVAPSGFTLGLTDADVALLTGNFVLSKEAAAMGSPLPPIIDAAGVAHQIPDIEDLTALMVAYGGHRAAISAEYAARRAAIEV